jgi:hypothetical protein
MKKSKNNVRLTSSAVRLNFNSSYSNLETLNLKNLQNSNKYHANSNSINKNKSANFTDRFKVDSESNINQLLT